MTNRHSSIPFPADPHDRNDDRFARHDQMVRGSMSASRDPVGVLLASPWTSSGDGTLSRYLTDWYFFDNIFTENDSSHRLVLRDLLEGRDARAKIIALVGYRGSGKTTFIRWLERVTQSPILIFDFKSLPAFRSFNPSINEIAEDRIMAGAFAPVLSRLIRWDRDENQMTVTRKIGALWDSIKGEAELSAYADYPGLSAFKSAITNLESDDDCSGPIDLTEITKAAIRLPMELALLFVLLLFLHDDVTYEFEPEVSGPTEYGKPVFIAFDNLDSLIEDTLDAGENEVMTNRLFRGFLNAFAQALMLTVDFTGMLEDDQLAERWTRTRFILTERRTTWQMSKTDHAEALNRMTAVVSQFNDMSTVVVNETMPKCADRISKPTGTVPVSGAIQIFPFNEVIRAREQYLERDTLTKDCNAAHLARFLNTVFSDYSLSRRLKPLFNFNIRALTEELALVIREREECIGIETILRDASTRDHAQQGLLHLGRGWLIGTLCRSFHSRGYFGTALSEQLSFLDPAGRTLSANTGHLILTYLHSRTKRVIIRPNISLHDSVTGQELAEAFDGLFDREHLAHILWGLYSRRTPHSRNRWARLIEFVGDAGIGASHLRRLMASAPDSVGVRITHAGVTYLEFLMSHFELMNVAESQRRQKAWRPLASFIEDEDWKTRALIEIQPVVDHVRKCFEELTNFNEACFVNSRFDRDWEAFRASSHCLKASGSSRSSDANGPFDTMAMTRAERIVFSHLGYLDSLRLAMVGGFPPISNKGAPINQTFLGFEQNYLDMLSQRGHASRGLEELRESLENCIEHIRGLNFEDCRTPVDGRIGSWLRCRPGELHDARDTALAGPKRQAAAAGDEAALNWISFYERYVLK